MVISTLIDAKWENKNVEYSHELIDISNVYYKKLSGRYEGKILLIDSFLNIVDIVPEEAVEITDTGVHTHIANRYNSILSNGISELKEIYRARVKQDKDKKRITVFTVCPTYSCNMACIYCFERRYNTDNNVISKENLKKLLSHIRKEITSIRKADPKRPIRIEFFGGEPLQKETYNVMKETLDFARELGCEISIVTNGYLLIEYASLLVQYRDALVEVMVTLDGPRDIHNAVRRSKKKDDDAFQKIVSGIDLYLELGIPVNVSTNIDRHNAEHVKELFQFYHEKGWDESPYFFAVIGRVYDRPAKEISDNLMTESEIFEIFLEMFPDGNGPRWMRFGFLKTTEQIAKDFHIAFKQNEYGKAPLHYCWATSPIISGYYVDSALNTFRCTTTVGFSKYTLGSIENVDCDTFEKSEIWGNSNVFTREECLKCKIGGFCGGGCVLERDARGKQICIDEQKTFNHFMEKRIIPNLEKYEKLS